MSKFYFKNKEFVIENYDQTKPFASFLPGIAGVHGIPLWCHYVNRGQAIASFGLRDKNGCILEFYPANTAYRIADKLGYRTFVKINGVVVEPFSPVTDAKRLMYISEAKVRIEEQNEQFKIEVSYFNLPNENVAGLVRRVKITNLGSKASFEVLDGITQLLATDSNEWMLKHQSNLLKSWNDCQILDGNVAYYCLTSIPGDTAEVKMSVSGNYYYSKIDNEVVMPIYDANVIFGDDSTLTRARVFEKESVSEILKKQNVAADKVGVGFSGCEKVLENGEEIIIETIIGNAANKDFIINKAKDFSKDGYFELAEKEASLIIEDFTKDVYTKTNYELFDNYMRQNYLDNILRGGYPLTIKGKDKEFIYHIYSRRHGDMEREYNFYSIAPEYYSQGNGNFRDVCQNRRSDSLFHPNVEIFNAKLFASLIQLDGYNPLGVLGSTFVIDDKTKVAELAKLFSNEVIMEGILGGEFTPGMIVNTMELMNITSSLSEQQLFDEIFSAAHQEIKADFGEGYWSDHWTYILDLVENAFKVFPEKKEEFLYLDNTYRYYNSPVYVYPRSEKYVLNNQGHVRQYGSLMERDEEKIAKCGMNPYGTNWVKDVNGNYVTTNLFGKLFTLATLKFSMLDNMLIGIEMEGNKPGWNDAMNGLPGLFGSGVSETIELARVVKFLKENLASKSVILPSRLVKFVKDIALVYSKNLSSFDTWDQVTSLREAYRSDTRFNIESLEDLKADDFTSFIKMMENVLNQALNRALELGKGIYPTFLTYVAKEYTMQDRIGHYGLPLVNVKKFELSLIPYFLEAPARSMKYVKDFDLLKKQYELVKQTELYDQVLKVYKTSTSLDDCSFEIGRVRAFQKGWLERESNFLHMTYKYLLGLLKAHMYDEFYEEIKTNFVCFMDPQVYGRSTLENSSFLATSNNPDSHIHGNGFVARLSGSTAEMLSMWNSMMFGDEPLKVVDGKLTLNLCPKLHASFFKDGVVCATLFSSCLVKYINETGKNTYDCMVVDKYIIDGVEYKSIEGKLAEEVRCGLIKAIDVVLK